MDELIAVILIAFGTIIGLIILWKFFDIVRNSIKGKKGSDLEETFERMAHAFINHKKETERRLQNIEAVISQENEVATDNDKKTDKKLDETNYESIEIDEYQGRMKNALKQDEKTSKQKRKTK